MKINIIGTGSGGNAIMFCDSVLLDVGVPFKYLKDLAAYIDVVLLTHIHADHFNKGAIRKLFIENDSIKFCCGSFLSLELISMGLPKASIITVESGKVYKSGAVTFSPFDLHHDVQNFGYRIVEGNHRHIHATDTFTLNGITAKDYDSATVECNHELDAALSIIIEKDMNGEFCHLKRAIKTHLSVDKAISFIKENDIKKLYPVHIGGSTKKEVFTVLKKVLTLDMAH